MYEFYKNRFGFLMSDEKEIKKTLVLRVLFEINLIYF